MLSGRVAFVTGAASGIGRAVAQVLAREGARVAVADVNHEGCNETIKAMEQQQQHFPIIADVASAAAVKAAAKQVGDHFGQAADIVVNSAGITKDGYMLKMSEENFDKVIAVNLKGTFNVNKAFAERMVMDKVAAGSIVNIASVVAQIGNKGQANYAASKGGVISMTKTAAKELGKFGIRVNCICPGFIETPMTDVIPEHLMQILLMQIPLGHMGAPEDIAETAAFLASNRSKYINGAEINVNGGLL